MYFGVVQQQQAFSYYTSRDDEANDDAAACCILLCADQTPMMIVGFAINVIHATEWVVEVVYLVYGELHN